MTPLLDVRHLVKEFPAPRRAAAARHAGARGRRRQLLDRGRRDVRPGRRIRQRQDDDGPVHAAADRADVGRGALQGPGRAGVSRRASMRQARRRHADRLPGSVLVAQPADAGAATSSKSRSSSIASARASERHARVRELFELVGLDPARHRRVSARVQRRPAPAHRRWRARSRSSRRSSSPTSRCRRSTCRCRRRSSTC